MAEVSAGVVLFRRRREPAARGHDEAHRPGAVEVLCAHMGGPFWARKDEHAWSFPKGLVEPGEDGLDAARRELTEELGVPAPAGEYRRLGEYRYGSGKIVVLYAVQGDLDVSAIVPGTFELEWPPRSGRRQAFPEVDRAQWFDVPTARVKLVAGQVPALDDLETLTGK